LIIVGYVNTAGTTIAFALTRMLSLTPASQGFKTVTSSSMYNFRGIFRKLRVKVSVNTLDAATNIFISTTWNDGQTIASRLQTLLTVNYAAAETGIKSCDVGEVAINSNNVGISVVTLGTVGAITIDSVSLLGLDPYALIMSDITN